MKIAKEPYFLKNDDWYEITEDGYELKENAPKKAVESYNEFQRLIREYEGQTK